MFAFRQWHEANEIFVAEEISFFPPEKSLWRKTARTEVIAAVRSLFCFTVLHQLDTSLHKYVKLLLSLHAFHYTCEGKVHINRN